MSLGSESESVADSNGGKSSSFGLESGSLVNSGRGGKLPSLGLHGSESESMAYSRGRKLLVIYSFIQGKLVTPLDKFD